MLLTIKDTHAHERSKKYREPFSNSKPITKITNQKYVLFVAAVA